MKVLSSFATLVLLVCAGLSAPAQTLNRNVFTTNGQVYATAQRGDTLFVGGTFSQMGWAARRFTRFASGSTKPDFSFPQLDQNSTLYAVEPDGSGGYYLAGYIYSYNGTKFYESTSGAAGVIHILADYSLDPTFLPTDMGGSQPQCLKKKGNRLYVGGFFYTINGTSRQFLGALNATTGALDSWTPATPDYYVDKIEASDDLVYIRGGFSYLGANYVPSQFAALKTTDGSYTKYLSAGYNAIQSFNINNNKLWLGGSFTSLGYTAQGIASVNNTTGAQDLAFPETDGYIYAALADGSGGYYVGGSFYNIGGVTRYNLAHILSNGTVDPAFNVQVNSTVQCMATDGTNLYFGGSFSNVNSTTRYYAAAVNRATGNLTTWNPDADSYVLSMVYAGNTVYMGGYFTTVKGTARSYAAAVTTGNILSAWNPAPDGYVYQMIPNSNGTSIFMGGSFYTVKGSSRQFLARVNTTNGTPAAWNPSPNSYVNALALNGSKLYIGGSFYSVNGVAKQYFAEIDTTSNNPTAYQADANGQVQTLNIIGNKLYVGGNFTQLKNVNIAYAARIDLTSKTVDSWNPAVNSTPFTFAGSGSNVLLGGQFYLANSAAKKNLAAVDLSTNQLTSFAPNVTSWSVSNINALHFVGNEVFAGGYLSYYNPDYTAYYYSLIALDTASGNVSRYFDHTPTNGYTVQTITSAGNKLYVGGSLSQFYDSTGAVARTRNNLATYNLSNSQLTNEIYDPNSTVRVLLPDGSGGVIAAGDFTLTNYVDRSYLGAINLTTGQAFPWRPYISGSVYSMALKDTSLYIGGTFSYIYNEDYSINESRQYLAAISTKTALATAWNADANYYVESMALADTILYVGGSYFNTIKGVTRNYVAAIGTGGTGTVKAWNPNPNNKVFAIQPAGSNVYLAGYFSTVKGIARNYLASVNNTNGNLNSWNPNPDSYVNSLTANNTTLYAGGTFGTIAGQSRQSVAAFNLSSNAITSFNPRLANTNGGYPYLTGLAQYGKHLFMGSDGTYYQTMDSIKGAPRHILGAADTTTGNATTFKPDPNSTIRTLKTSANKLFVGGDFTELGISPASTYLSVFTLEPLSPPTNLTFTALQPTSVTANFTKGSGEGRFVVVKEGSAAGVPQDGNGYNANAAFGQGSDLSGGFVVYKNSGNSVNVTNLLPNHTYYFAVYEYNGTGNATDYLQNPSLTGSITTPCPTYTNIVSPAGPLQFCQGDSAVLTAISGMNSYLWSTGATTRSITVKTGGSYTVQVSDSNSCGGTSQPVVVTVNAKPTPTTTPSGTVTIASGSSTNITVNESYPSYLWSTSATTQSITVNAAGSYTATVTDGNGCKGTTAPVTVTVSGGCAKPTGLVASNITANSATLSWNVVSTATKYNVQYRVSGTTTWTKTSTTATSKTITGLTPNTVYNWRVQAVCPSGNSTFTSGKNFTTAASLLAGSTSKASTAPTASAFGATIYPNPATSSAVLSIWGTVHPVTATITDMTGKVLWKSGSVQSTRISLPVGNLGSALYLVSVTDGTNTKVVKLVKGQQ